VHTMQERLAIYRNLNKVGRDFKRFHFTFATPLGSPERRERIGLKIREHSAYAPGMDGFESAATGTTFTIENVRAYCDAEKLRRMNAAGENMKRTVAAFVTGNAAPRPASCEYRISIDPKRGETCFVWADSVARPSVNWANVDTLTFTINGMFATVK
jgi:hypothetical protein